MIKENFCPPCMVPLLAGSTAIGSTIYNNKNKKWNINEIILLILKFSFILFICYILYIILSKYFKDCEKCKILL